MAKRDLRSIVAAASADLRPIQHGRGLAGMLSGNGPAQLENARALPLEQIEPNPYQARQVFDLRALGELEASIRAHGVLEPILVRPHGDHFQIVAGERRYRATKAAGLATIPAMVRDDLSDQDAALITALENLQRQDLDLEDEARQFQTLLTVTGLSQRELAGKLGVSHNYIAERVRLLGRPDLLTAYRGGAVTLRQALAQQRAPAPVAADHLSPASADTEPVSADDPDSAALVERPDLDRPPVVIPDYSTPSAASPHPGEAGPRWRYVEEAYRPLKRIQPQAIPGPERLEWARQLRELSHYVGQLAQAIEAADA